MIDDKRKKEELSEEIEELRSEKMELERRIADRRKAERSVKVFKIIADKASYGISICSLDGKISYVNKAFADMHEYSQEELIGKDVFFLHPAEEHEAVDKVFMRLKQEGSVAAVEMMHKRKDGTVFPMMMNATVIKNEQGKDLFFSKTVVDISDRKEAEKALKESEEKWVSLVRNAPGFIIIADRDGTIQFINRTVTGFTVGETIGTSIYDYVQPEYHELARSTIEYVFRTGQPSSYESEVGSPGRTVWYDTQVGPLRRDDSIDAVTLIATDITERKESEKALQESEQKYRLIMENARDLICVMKLNGAITYASPSHSQLGYTKEDLVGRSGFDLVPLDDRIKLLPVLERYARVILRGAIKERLREAVERLEFKIIDKKGNLHDMESTASLIKSPTGKGYDILLLSRDVTERKRHAEVLKESEERFRTIFENATDGIVLAEAETKKFGSANKVFCEMIGYSPEEIKKMKVTDIHPKESLPYVLGEFEKQMKKEKTLAKDIPVKRKDGSVFFADVNSNPVVISGKEYLMGIFRDVTERKETKDSLQESEQKFRAIFDNANDGICLADIGSRKLFVANKRICQMMGYSGEEFKGLKVEDIHPDEARAFAMDQFRRSSLGEITKNEDTPLKRKDGSVFYADINTSLVTLGGKKYLLGIFRDITENKYMEETLRKSEILYRTIFENTGTAAVIVEGDMKISVMNDEFLKLSGYSEKEIEGWESILSFVKDENREKVKEYHRLRRIDPEAAPRNYEIKVVTKRGKVRDVYMTVAIIPDTEKSLASFLDVTELKRSETELKKQKELLDNTNKALEHKLGELQAAVKHIKKLEGIVPICANCKKMLAEGRDPKNPKAWVTLEEYISARTDASFSHGLCPDCIRKLYGDRQK